MAQHASHVPRAERRLTPTATMTALVAALVARSHAGSRRAPGWSAGGIRPRGAIGSQGSFAQTLGAVCRDSDDRVVPAVRVRRTVLGGTFWHALTPWPASAVPSICTDGPCNIRGSQAAHNT
jgi:hypothetical protein